MTEVNQSEVDQLGALLREHKIDELIAKHKPQALVVSFDAQWIDNSSLAASFPRINSAGPYFITLSPLLLQWGLTDRTAFSTIVLHELGHIIDRAQNWRMYTPGDHTNLLEALEYEADDFVVACGWRDGLIDTLRRTVACGREDGIPEGMAIKRLFRLTEAA